MAKPQWEALIEQLQDPDPNVRRKACRRLASTNDPQVIPFLKNVYVQEDDERVRQAAHDALAAFKAMQVGVSARRLPLDEQRLKQIVIGLAVLFVISLVLNGLVMVLGGDNDDNGGSSSASVPTNRDVLTGQLEGRLSQAQDDAANLRQEIEAHNDSGQVVCSASFHKPQQYVLSDLDRTTYRDLAVVVDNLNLVLLQLQQPQSLWDRICSSQTPSLPDGVEALRKLDVIDDQMIEVDQLLQKAILEPAPTFGPSITPTPTLTYTPSPTDTPEPTATPQPGTPTDISPTDALPTETPTTAPTETPTATPTVTATPLPYPDLDYPAILRDLSARFTVIGDLQNAYGTGMIDYWQKGIDGAAVTFCDLSEWPQLFEPTAEQLAELQRTDAADPELEEAITLTNDGLTLAYQAREIYQYACWYETLSETTEQDLALAEQALEKLVEAQQLVEAIRRRE